MQCIDSSNPLVRHSRGSTCERCGKTGCAIFINDSGSGCCWVCLEPGAIAYFAEASSQRPRSEALAVGPAQPGRPDRPRWRGAQGRAAAATVAVENGSGDDDDSGLRPTGPGVEAERSRSEIAMAVGLFVLALMAVLEQLMKG